MRFIPSDSSAFDKEQPGWWFIFRSNDLLVKTTGKQIGIPFSDDIGLLDPKLSSVHYLGTLDGFPCYSAWLIPSRDLSAWS